MNETNLINYVYYKLETVPNLYIKKATVTSQTDQNWRRSQRKINYRTLITFWTIEAIHSHPVGLIDLYKITGSLTQRSEIFRKRAGTSHRWVADIPTRACISSVPHSCWPIDSGGRAGSLYDHNINTPPPPTISTLWGGIVSCPGPQTYTESAIQFVSARFSPINIKLT